MFDWSGRLALFHPLINHFHECLLHILVHSHNLLYIRAPFQFIRSSNGTVQEIGQDIEFETRGRHFLLNGAVLFRMS
jgi:hypothetical protein